VRAAWFERYGPARDVLKVGELPTPEPGQGEVRVRVHASGINPSDVKRRSGIRERAGYPLIVPHSDGAGVIDALGPGVEGWKAGDRVWIHTAQRDRPFGTAAEYVTLPVHLIVALPESCDFLAGAGLGVPAMTAHVCLFDDGPPLAGRAGSAPPRDSSGGTPASRSNALAGRTVLVTGGAGAVGCYAVQLARLAGARVLTTVSTPDKAAIARDCGADVVINYRDEDVAARVMEATDGRGVDRVVEVDLAANIAVTDRVLARNGVLAAYSTMFDPTPRVPVQSLMFRSAVIRLVAMQTVPMAIKVAAAAAIRDWCAAGALRHPRSSVLPLDAIADAHELVESGRVVGKVVLAVAPGR